MYKVLQPESQFQLLYDFDYITTLYDMGIKSGIHGLKDKKVQELIHRNDIQFDLIISEQFFQESWLMFSRKYSAPVITIGKDKLFVGCLRTYKFKNHFNSRNLWLFRLFRFNYGSTNNVVVRTTYDIIVGKPYIKTHMYNTSIKLHRSNDFRRKNPQYHFVINGHVLQKILLFTSSE